MNEYKKSNYAINKVRKWIVYRNANGSLLEVTFEKIAKDNPNFTVEDFEKLKRLSDELFHEEEKGDNRMYLLWLVYMQDLDGKKRLVFNGIVCF